MNPKFWKLKKIEKGIPARPQPYISLSLYIHIYTYLYIYPGLRQQSAIALVRQILYNICWVDVYGAGKTYLAFYVKDNLHNVHRVFRTLDHLLTELWILYIDRTNDDLLTQLSILYTDRTLDHILTERSILYIDRTLDPIFTKLSIKNQPKIIQKSSKKLINIDQKSIKNR